MISLNQLFDVHEICDCVHLLILAVVSVALPVQHCIMTGAMITVWCQTLYLSWHRHLATSPSLPGPVLAGPGYIYNCVTIITGYDQFSEQNKNNPRLVSKEICIY